MSEYLFNELQGKGFSSAQQWRILFKRRSTAAFTPKKLNDRAEEIMTLLDQCPLPFEGQDLHMDWIGRRTLEDILMNDIKKVIEAPHYLIFSAIPNAASQYNLGYLMQILALWLHAEKLGMRYQSHFSTPEPEDDGRSDFEGFDRRSQQSPTMLPLIVAVGEPLRLQRRPARTLRLRRSFFLNHTLPQSTAMRQILKAAISAPSDGTTMPWLFMVDGASVTIFVRSDYRFNRSERSMRARVSGGALLCNLLLSARIRHLDADVYQSKDVGTVGGYEYMCTVQLY